MKKWVTTPMAALIGISSISPTFAADIRFNGFASVVGGMTSNQGQLKNPLAPTPAFPEGDETFLADGPSNGIYDDDFSFRPDSIYGLQVTADVGEGLSVTAQFTGAGGEDFNAEVQWAYASYDVTPSGTVSAGRMRIPYFFYSDYLDVAYAYPWIRPPAEVYSIPVSGYEGVQYLQQFSVGSWDGRFQAYYGESKDLAAGGRELLGQDLTGVVAYIANSWLQLRASYLIEDLSVEGAAFNGVLQDEENPVASSFGGVAARAQLGDGFVIAEYILSENEDPIAPNLGEASNELNAWYVSVGYTFGSFTPHLTYAEKDTTATADADFGFGPLYTKDQSRANASITAGVRWDFHPSAALKAEYTSSKNKSSNEAAAIWGEEGEVDLFTVGIDLIF